MLAARNSAARCLAQPRRSSPSSLRARAMTTTVTAQLTQDELKQQAAFKAVDYVKSGMKVGLGTGSTAAFAVDRIGALLKSGELKDLVCVPTSVRTYEQAKALGIPLATLDEVPRLDVAIDGADEVDGKLDVVKGRGGALLREKMVEIVADTFVCIVDDTKLVSGLGGSGLAMPVEIVQFCSKFTLDRLRALPSVKRGLREAKIRDDGNGGDYVTDNGNFIVDLYFDSPIEDSRACADEIAGVVGVVDHGLFLDMVDVCIVAGATGIEVKQRSK
jgi:ribose 5-phosphate isomerase A